MAMRGGVLEACHTSAIARHVCQAFAPVSVVSRSRRPHRTHFAASYGFPNRPN